MLKIKDNVNLKELEKFGFEENEYDYFYFQNPGQYKEIRILINIKTRNIKTDLDPFADNYIIHDKIYDLIKADLIEKVEN